MLTRIAAFIAIFFAPVLAFGQALADHVPSDAMVYVGWRGVADLGPGYPQSNLKAVLDECDVKTFIADFLPAVMDRIGREDQQAAGIMKIVGTIAKPSWQQPTAFFIAGVDMPQNGPPTPHLGIIWKPGADADSLKTQLEQLTSQLQPPFPVKVVHVGDLVALMVGYDNAEAALNSADKSLAQDSTFKSALNEVTKDPVAAIYINYEKLLDLLTKFAQQNDPKAAELADKIFTKTGVRGLKRIVAAAGFDGKDWATSAFVEAPEPRTGLLQIAGVKPLGEQMLGIIPRTATMAGAARLDLSPIFPTIRDTIREVQPDAADQIDNVIKELARQSGVDIEKDLVGSLGDEWAYFTDPAVGGQGLASLTVVNHLKDAAAFEKAMSKIEDFALQQIEQQMGADKLHLSFSTVQIDGLTVHYLAVPFVSPSWVVHDGYLYAAAFPQVAAAAARRGVDPATSILKNAGYVALRERLGHGSEASGMSFDDLPQTAPQAYGSWLMISRLAGFGDLFGIKSPPILLPPLQKLMTHLSPAGAVKWADEKGFHVRSVEPFPGATMIASDPAISAIYAEPFLLGVTLPAMNKAREQANRIKSANNLRQIGLAALMYANANKNKFPADQGTIFKDEEISLSVFVNPRTGHMMPPPEIQNGSKDAAAAWVNEHSDYVYVGGGKNVTAPADVIIAYEKTAGMTDGINILYADCHVEWLPMAEAMPQIEKIHGPQ